MRKFNKNEHSMQTDVTILSMVKQSFRENYKAGLLLQSAALGVVLLYYFQPSFQQVLQSLGTWKQTGGILFSAVSTALFGGLLPFFVIWLGDRSAVQSPISLLAFYVLFWFWKGMEVDVLYRFQAFLYGDSNAWHVVLRKVLTDQLVYCPLWAVPTMMLFYLWKDSDFRFTTMKAKFREDPFSRRWLRILMTNLVVWLPAVTIIYQLPLVLQLPLFNIVLAFWTLILNSISKK